MLNICKYIVHLQHAVALCLWPNNCKTQLYYNSPKWSLRLSPLQQPTYVYFVFISSTDDVLAGDRQWVDATSSVTLEHVYALQRLKLPHL